jgi:hypothetical protein
MISGREQTPAYPSTGRADGVIFSLVIGILQYPELVRDDSKFIWKSGVEKEILCVAVPINGVTHAVLSTIP